MEKVPRCRISSGVVSCGHGSAFDWTVNLTSKPPALQYLDNLGRNNDDNQQNNLGGSDDYASLVQFFEMRLVLGRFTGKPVVLGR